MPLIHDNFPDEVWARLKAWAKVVARGSEVPSTDDCALHVERLAREITGIPNALRAEVVQFYASETAEMIARYRAEAPVT